MAYQLKDASGDPVKYQGKEVFADDRIGSVKAINRESRTLTITGTDETKDRDGDIISVKGWQMDNFMKNPVFLYAHNYSSVPIGSAIKVIKRKDPPKLDFIEKFPSVGLYPFADMIFELFNEKILNASSVGFIPGDWEPLTAENGGKSEEDVMMENRGRRYLKQELLELSACPVPSNPNALQNSVKFMKSHTADEIALLMAGDQDFSLKREDVLGELNVKEIEFIDEEEIKVFVPANFDVTKEEDEELVTIKGEHENQEVKEEKTGAVLNAKNTTRLIDASNLIDEVLVEAGVQDPDVSLTISDLMEQFMFLRAEVLDLSTYIKGVKPDQLESNDPVVVIEENSLLDEYEKVLSQDDNENKETESDLSPEEEDIIKQIVEGLKQIANPEEEILKQVTLNLKNLAKE